MNILCPHCQNPIEVVKLSSREEIACPSCGSSFRLETDTNTGWENSQGQTLGRFELLGVLGHGAFGTVYKARDPELDRPVAVKVPRAGNLAGPQERDRFLREARSAAQLRHPSFVTVHEVGQSDGLPYLVSDFVAGVTLADGGDIAATTRGRGVGHEVARRLCLGGPGNNPARSGANEGDGAAAGRRPALGEGPHAIPAGASPERGSRKAGAGSGDRLGPAAGRRPAPRERPRRAVRTSPTSGSSSSGPRSTNPASTSPRRPDATRWPQLVLHNS
jgi:hypothetical protein